MRIVFMGTPEFAVASLKALVDKGHEICAVFTRKDAPKNRGMKLFPPPVKVYALEHNIPVYQPVSLKNDKWKNLLSDISPDIIVVAAYGKILPLAILNSAKYGSVNVHASILPKYRGASPINAAILNGESKAGVTIMQMAEGLDTGDMLNIVETDIGESETYGQLHDRLAVIGGDALIETLRLIEQGKVIAKKQDDARSCYAPMISTPDTAVDFTKDARTVSCQIRAYDPQPGAFCTLEKQKIKLFSASIHDAEGAGTPGLVRECIKKGFVVECRQGSILISEIQMSGGKKMDARAFYAGHRDIVGKVLQNGIINESGS